MEQNKDRMIPDDSMPGRKDLEPGRSDRNLLDEKRQEAPIDRDLPMSATQATDAGDETYEDEEMNDPDYFEKRAGDDVRK